MDVEEDEIAQQCQLMQDEAENDIFDAFLRDSKEPHTREPDKEKKLTYHRSTKLLSRRESLRKILNTSSSNEKDIPSSIKNDSSRENSERERNVFETENSNQESFRKSFKKRHEESFSIENTIRDSSSSVSERSDCKSVQNILPQCYREDEPLIDKKPGCNCKKSKCLKLYCECFQKQLFCSPTCNCNGCGNHAANHNHHQAIIEALARNAHSFQEKNTDEHPSSSSVHTPAHSHTPTHSHNPELKGFSLGVQPEEVRKGCKCKKTKCIKKYCECYQSGVGCSIFCRCEGCFNTGFHKAEQDLHS